MNATREWNQNRRMKYLNLSEAHSMESYYEKLQERTEVSFSLFRTMDI